MNKYMRNLPKFLTLLVVLAYSFASFGWLFHTTESAKDFGIPATSTMLVYAQLKGIQDLFLVLLLITFLFQKNVKAIVTSLIIGLLIPIFDSVIVYSQTGNVRLIIVHFIFIAMQIIAGISYYLLNRDKPTEKIN